MSTNGTISEQNTAGRNEIPKEIAEHYGISGFRTEKFANDEADSALVDRCSDSPAMKDVLESIYNAAMSVQIK